MQWWHQQKTIFWVFFKVRPDFEWTFQNGSFVQISPIFATPLLKFSPKSEAKDCMMFFSKEMVNVMPLLCFSSNILRIFSFVSPFSSAHLVDMFIKREKMGRVGFHFQKPLWMLKNVLRTWIAKWGFLSESYHF